MGHIGPRWGWVTEIQNIFKLQNSSIIGPPNLLEACSCFTSGAQSLGAAEQAFGASPDCGTRGASFASPF